MQKGCADYLPPHRQTDPGRDKTGQERKLLNISFFDTITEALTFCQTPMISDTVREQI